MANLIATVVLVVATGFMVFLPGCHSLNLADGRSVDVLGLVVPQGEHPRGSDLFEWIAYTIAGVVGVGTGGVGGYAAHRARKRRKSPLPANPVSRPAEPILTMVAPDDHPDPPNAA